MTRDNAIAEIRGTKRTCRGLWRIPEADRAVLHKQWHTVRSTNNIDDGLNFKLALEMSLGVSKHEPVGDVTWDFVERRVAELVFSCNENCGFDVNDLICAHPFDGVEREVPCPKCGQIALFSTFYELEA
jgi:hypothetical protein